MCIRLRSDIGYLHFVDYTRDERKRIVRNKDYCIFNFTKNAVNDCIPNGIALDLLT